MTILETALEYLNKHKFSIFPANPSLKKSNGAKSPLIKEVIPYRKKLPTQKEVIDWWTKWPNAMIAGITGEQSNLLVLDADSQKAIDTINELVSDSLEIPFVNTPGGGKHFYFQYQEGLANYSKGIIHIRNEGAYIILPGSVRADGRCYVLDNGCRIEDRPALPNNVYKYLLSFSLYTGVTKTENEDCHNISQVSQDVTNYFDNNRRDEDLIHAAICLQKGGSEPDFADRVLNILVNSWGENDPKWVATKIKSAWDRAARRERNISQEVRDWVEMMRMTSQTCHINVTDWSHESQSITKKDMHAARMAFKRLCSEPEPMIERFGDKAGQYRIINREDNEQKWWLDEGKPLPLIMPLGIEKYAKVFPGNIILLEGQKSQGKSTFSLEFSRLNCNLYPGKKVIYQNVEMSDSELTDRFIHYQERNIIEKDEWKKFIKIIKQTSNWHDKIEPDGINIIDYLVEYEKPYILPKFIFDIHRKLKTGIALCVVQRDPFKPYPSGGRAVRDIPRLIISLIKHCLRLEDVKSFWPNEFGNPSGLGINYNQIAYCEWRANGTWEKMEESKYEQFKKNTKYESFLKED